jgi:hypothetical protein
MSLPSASLVAAWRRHALTISAVLAVAVLLLAGWGVIAAWRLDRAGPRTIVGTLRIVAVDRSGICIDHPERTCARGALLPDAEIPAVGTTVRAVVMEVPLDDTGSLGGLAVFAIEPAQAG